MDVEGSECGYFEVFHVAFCGECFRLLSGDGAVKFQMQTVADKYSRHSGGMLEEIALINLIRNDQVL